MMHRPALLSLACAITVAATTASADQPSEGRYRLPFADGTLVKVFDDAGTHRPKGRVDLFGVDGKAPYRVVAAAAGRIAAIQDGFAEQQSGRAAKDCHNNYVWIEHPNGEWTNYSHLAQGSVTGLAHRKPGDKVRAGDVLGIEGAVGCAMLDHVHFEVARPARPDAIDAGGFLRDNDEAQRERTPRFCAVPGEVVAKDHTYVAQACGSGKP
jgi:murein DD-endopeptidase MepM/ murein hydrolase activator NlpD